MPNTLPPALDAQELTWDLPSAGQVLCYHKAGEGRPLLLLHSINAVPSAIEVSPFFEHQDLLFHRPLYAPDLPGFGRSAREDLEYSPAFYARAIVEIIQAIGGGEAVDIVALSTTSEFAARAAQLQPQLINSLALLSPTGFTRRRKTVSKAGPRVHGVLRLPGLGAGLFRLLRSRRSIRYFLGMGFEGNVPEAMVDYASLTATQPGASYAPFFFLSTQMFAPDAVGDLYLPLTHPALVIFDKDPNISFEHLDEVVDARPNWQKRRISPTRGLPHFDEPLRTREALEAFWSGADAS